MLFEITIKHRIGACKIAVDFTAEASLTAITGPSGAGKTTLLNCIAGLIVPDEGRVVIGGRVLLDTAQGIALPVEHRRVGYVFQDTRLFPHLKVRANLAYGENLAHERLERIDRDEVIEVLGIAPLLDRWPASLSGGEIRRVAIARALLSRPGVLLLDEPLASLDKPRAADILAMIAALRDRIALPMLYVSHEPDEVKRLTTSVVALT